MSRKPTPQDLQRIQEVIDYSMKNHILETDEQIILVVQKTTSRRPKPSKSNVNLEQEQKERARQEKARMIQDLMPDCIM